jgi:hypothetical protein
MKKLSSEAPDVPQSVANRAAKIVEKHLRLHGVGRAKDLPEEAKVRLYRDLRFFLDSGGQPSDPGPGGAISGARRFLSGLWGKIEDFLSMSEGCRSVGPIGVLALAGFGEATRTTAVGWSVTIAPRGEQR